ncbi:MAG: hypothetical protein GY702_29445 [Desulfobulbaceae bacterium]|nr:hypothetical protein [Desulfobulbaceae bacterium]
MQIYLSIDDTDNHESPGSGQLAETLTKELQKNSLTKRCSSITRHQLFVHENIPFTSHNSAMCFCAELAEFKLNDVIEYSEQFLINSSAPGSDPGLCVVKNEASLDKQALVDFGLLAKGTVLSKGQAYFLASTMGIHLSEHGGTGDGIIGALAGTGLRIQGFDGRFRGWLNLGETGTLTTPSELCSHSFVDAVIDENGNTLAPDAAVTISDSKVKTVHHHHQQVIPVTRDKADTDSWRTLDRKEVKKF